VGWLGPTNEDTPDRKLIEFGKVALPEKRILTPDEFKTEYLIDV
jgi:hypothetical protein